MNIQTRANDAGGFTLMELLVAFGLGVFVVGVVVALSIFTSANFLGTANYVRLNDQSRNAVDQISREIRNALGQDLLEVSYLDPADRWERGG